MEDYSVDHKYLQSRRDAMDEAEQAMRNNLLAKGVGAPLTDAIVQKFKDFHRSRYQYMQMREEFREREYRVRRRAAQVGLQLSTPIVGVYLYDLSSLEQRKKDMDLLTDHLVQWMHAAKMDPYLRLTIHQEINDADIGRRDELRLIEGLKVKLSIVGIWEQTLEAHTDD